MPVDAVAASLDIEALCCSRGNRRLVRDFNLELRPGELCHLRGANGRGKSTVIKTVCGLRAPDSGSVSWMGENILAGSHVFGGDLVYIGHENAVNLDLSPVENLASLTALHGEDVNVEDCLRAAGLARRLHLACRRLSAGQRRRVALSRLVQSSAKFWLLDEPAAALDVQGRAWLSDLLLAHAEKGGMVLFTAHEELLDRAQSPAIRSVSL